MNRCASVPYTASMKAEHWYVYILKCADGTLYTGVTTDVARRVEEHNEGELGAKYTRAKRPVVLAYQEAHASRSIACKREAALKRLTRTQKLALIAG
jgi:putative endonuclease